MAFGDADASTPAFVKANGAGKNATTASFTPPNGALLIAFAWHDTAGGNLTNTSAITDSLGLAWSRKATRSKQDDGTGAANGHIAISTATATGSAMTVTTTGTNTGNPAGLYVRVITGADTTTPMDATPVEGTTNAAVVSTSITTATDGARAFLQVIDWNVAAAMTAGTGQTAVISDAIGATDDRVYLGVTNAVTSPAGSTTLSTGSPSSGNTQNWIGIAVRPAAGGSDASITLSAAVAAVAAVPAPTVSISAAITPATVAAVAAVPSPVVALGVAVVLATVAAVGAVPAPSLSTGSTVVLGGAVAAVAAVPTPTVSASGNVSITLATVAAVGAVPGPTLSTGSITVLTGPVAAVAAVPTPTILAVTQVQLQPVAAIAAVPATAVSVGSVVTLSAVAAVAAVLTPAVSTGAANALFGVAHGPLPVALGSITVHTVSIAGVATGA